MKPLGKAQVETAWTWGWGLAAGIFAEICVVLVIVFSDPPWPVIVGFAVSLLAGVFCLAAAIGTWADARHLREHER